jgi:hypothetical protein
VREAVDALRPIVRELRPDEQAFLGPVDPDAMLAELNKPETTHKRRLLIGERFGVLGEHPSRSGVGVAQTGRRRSIGGRCPAGT